MLGSAALNMCMVAQGKADAYYEFGVHCWDIAAGDVILREAGGVTMYPTGKCPLQVLQTCVYDCDAMCSPGIKYDCDAMCSPGIK